VPAKGREQRAGGSKEKIPSGWCGGGFLYRASIFSCWVLGAGCYHSCLPTANFMEIGCMLRGAGCRVLVSQGLDGWKFLIQKRLPEPNFKCRIEEVICPARFPDNIVVYERHFILAYIPGGAETEFIHHP